jgi:hypothetical protein
VSVEEVRTKRGIGGREEESKEKKGREKRRKQKKWGRKRKVKQKGTKQIDTWTE